MGFPPSLCYFYQVRLTLSPLLVTFGPPPVSVDILPETRLPNKMLFLSNKSSIKENKKATGNSKYCLVSNLV